MPFTSIFRALFDRLRARKFEPHLPVYGPMVWADLDRLDQIVNRHAAGDEVPDLFAVMDPYGLDFGTDVAAFIEQCCEQQILHLTAPITAVGIEATVGGEYRDGGFLVMVDIADRITVASGQLSSAVFRGAGDVARGVLASVVDIAGHTYQEFLSTAQTINETPPR